MIRLRVMPLTILPSLRFATRILPVLNSVCPCFRRIIAFSAGLYAFHEHPGLSLQRLKSCFEAQQFAHGVHEICLAHCTSGRPAYFVAVDNIRDLCPPVEGDSDAFYSAIIATVEPLHPFPADVIAAQDT